MYAALRRLAESAPAAVPPAAPGTFQTWPLLIDTAHVETRNTQHSRDEGTASTPICPSSRVVGPLCDPSAAVRLGPTTQHPLDPSCGGYIYGQRKGETGKISVRYALWWMLEMRPRATRRRPYMGGHIHGARTDTAQCRQRTVPGLILALIIYQSIIIWLSIILGGVLTMYSELAIRGKHVIKSLETRAAYIMTNGQWWAV